jgi:predicted ester cyclase
VRRVVPDRRRTIEDMVAEGDRVAVRWTDRGTHAGTLDLGSHGSFPGTGRPLELTGMSFFRVATGQIAEQWIEEDLLGLLRLLGAVAPAP